MNTSERLYESPLTELLKLYCDNSIMVDSISILPWDGDIDYGGDAE